MIRIAEIEIDSNYVEKYYSIFKEEASASVVRKSGVISIFPMYNEDGPTIIKILEIYASREAYESHLETPHFLKYKNSTLDMVQSLNRDYVLGFRNRNSNAYSRLTCWI